VRSALVGVAALVAFAATSAPAEAQGEPARVYELVLEGRFGQDVTPTPILNALAEARELRANYIIVTIDNDWFQQGGKALGLELPDDAGQFNEDFARKLAPHFLEYTREWEVQPKFVMWVKTAMGPGAFMPFLSDTIYFHPDARLGGISGVFAQYNQGDRLVHEKLVSIALATAKGLALENGYDPRLIEAMGRGDFTLSYSIVGGRPVFHERLPAGPTEFLLTNDASDEGNADSVEDVVRGRGKNYLTLRAQTAQDVGVSRGTVESMSDLLFELGIERNYEMVGDGSEEMERWSREIERAQDQLVRLWRDFNGVEVEGNEVRDQIRALGLQLSTLRRMIGIIERYNEGLIPYEFGFQFFNGDQWMAQLRMMILQIELQMAALRA
jgi:hypothetical protein